MRVSGDAWPPLMDGVELTTHGAMDARRDGLLSFYCCLFLEEAFLVNFSQYIPSKCNKLRFVGSRA